MWPFKKKKKYSDDAIKENGKAIIEMSQLISIAIVGVENPELKKRLKRIQDQVKYLNPTVDSRALAIDKKILDQIKDMRVEVSKPNNEVMEEKIEMKIRSIELLIPERIAYSKTYAGVKDDL